MTEILRVEGLDEAIRSLNKLAGGRWVQGPLKEYGLAVKAASAPYISKPPHSTYRRTGTLGRQWYTSVDDRSVTIGNRAPYSGYVQDRENQAWMHRQHGWHTVDDRAEAVQQKMVFIRAVRREVDRLFSG